MTQKWWENGTKTPMRNSRTSTSWFWQAAALLLCKMNLFPHARLNCKNQTARFTFCPEILQFENIFSKNSTHVFQLLNCILEKCYTLWQWCKSQKFFSLLIAKGNETNPIIGSKLCENTDQVSSSLNVWKPYASNSKWLMAGRGISPLKNYKERKREKGVGGERNWLYLQESHGNSCITYCSLCTHMKRRFEICINLSYCKGGPYFTELS